MIKLNNWPTLAVKKLAEGKKEVRGNKAIAMAPAVFDALKKFCLQEPEFAQAVVQGGSFAECMAAVAKGVGTAISDLEVYGKAVQFYFPGAKIHFQMDIDLVGDAAKPEPPALPDPEPVQKPTVLSLSLADFL